jgi:hypothetical protein
MTTSGYHVGDTSPPLPGTATGKVRSDYPALTDAEFNALEPVPVDLTDTTAAVAHVHRADGTTVSHAVTKGDQSTAKGSWLMPWSVGDLNVAGVFSVELETTWPGGAIRTFGFAWFQVARQIA